MSGPTISRPLPIEPLTRAAFEPFGAVIGPETANSPNLNRAPGNLGFLWVQHTLEFPKQAYVACLRYYYRGLRCDFLQKHPASTVCLLPLGAGMSTIVVAPDDGQERPEVQHARAFLLDGSAGIVLHRGIWTRYAYPLGAFTDYYYVTQRVDPATANSTDDVIRCRLDDQLGFVFDLVLGPPTGSGFELGASGAVVMGPPRNPPWE